MQIPGARGLAVKTLVKESIKDFSEDEMTTYAAALAYSVLFAVFPFLVFLLALLGFLQLSSFFDWLSQQAQAVVPQRAVEPVLQVIDEISRQDSGGLLSFGILAAIWSASAGIRAVMNALNVAYDVQEARPAWKRYLLSIIYTLGLAAMIIAAVALMLLGPQVIAWLAGQVGLNQLFVALWAWLRWPAAVVLLMLAVAVLYYVGPSIDVPFRLITPGSVVAVIAWVLASLAFGFYISNFGNYGATYGSLGAMIVLLFYFYLSAIMLLFGAEVNAVIEHHSPEGRRPAEQDRGGRQQPAPEAPPRERAVG